MLPRYKHKYASFAHCKSGSYSPWALVLAEHAIDREGLPLGHPFESFALGVVELADVPVERLVPVRDVVRANARHLPDAAKDAKIMSQFGL